MTIKYNIPRITEKHKIIALSKEAIGMSIGKWVIINDQITRDKRGYPVISVRCFCGKEAKRLLHTLTNGGTEGCLDCHNKKRHYLSDEIRKALYSRYNNMVQRCTNPNVDCYKDYGGRGIKVLFGSKDAYIEYILTELPHKNYIGLEIDRIDNEGHYEPGNLRLVTHLKNSRNRRTSKYIDYFGKQISIKEAAETLLMDNPEIQYSINTVRQLLQTDTPQEVLDKWKSKKHICKPLIVALNNLKMTAAEFIRLLEAEFENTISRGMIRHKLTKKGLTGDQIYAEHVELNKKG